MSFVLLPEVKRKIKKNSIACFTGTGIFPFNRDLFSATDFAPAGTTEQQLLPKENSHHARPYIYQEQTTDGVDPSQLEVSGNQARPGQEQTTDGVEPSQLEVSGNQASSQTPNQVNGKPYVSPIQTHPLPKAGTRKTSGGRKKRSTKY